MHLATYLFLVADSSVARSPAAERRGSARQGTAVCAYSIMDERERERERERAAFTLTSPDNLARKKDRRGQTAEEVGVGSSGPVEAEYDKYVLLSFLQRYLHATPHIRRPFRRPCENDCSPLNQSLLPLYRDVVLSPEKPFSLSTHGMFRTGVVS